MAMAGEAATPGKLRVGVLRRLIGEAGLLEHRYRAWAVSCCGGGLLIICSCAEDLCCGSFELL